MHSGFQKVNIFIIMSGNNIRIITEWQDPIEDLKNKNYKNVINMLLSKKRREIV